eukprot:2862305-Heterocapsa_arctica.AAC.1
MRALSVRLAASFASLFLSATLANKRPYSWTAVSSQTKRLRRFKNSLSSASTQHAPGKSRAWV